MPVSQTIVRQLEHASWIRRMFEEGARLKGERGAENIFDYTLGNPGVDPPAGVLEALRRAAAGGGPGVHGYMHNAGYRNVRELVAARLSVATGLPYTAEDVLMTVGSSGASNVFLKAILDPGDEVIVLLPCFSEYPFYVQNHAGTMAPVDTDEDFLPDVDRIAAAITPRTRAIILNSPNNPTGRVYPAEILRDLETLLARLDHPITVISDEPYKPITYDGLRPPEVASFITRTVVANSWSKSFAIAGERIGYLALSPRLPDLAELRNACTFTNRILGFINAPAIWQRVIAAAIDSPVDVAGYQRKRDLLCGALERIGYQLRRPEGTFYLFPRSPLADDIAFIRLLADEGVLGVPGTGFRRPGYFRLSFTVPLDTIERSIPAFERAFARR
jgi:aspartate aminotransferase